MTLPPAADVSPRPLTGVTADAAFRAYGRYVAAIAMRLLGRDDEVDDVVQDVFLDAVRGLGSISDPGAVKAWLATVTVRTARRRLRLRRVKAFLALDPARQYDDVASPDASPETRALLARVYALLDRLPVELRLAWTLRHVEGETLEDVAALCECSLATVKRRITAAHGAIGEAVGRG